MYSSKKKVNIPKEAACNKQFPSPEVERGHSRCAKVVHQLSLLLCSSDVRVEIEIKSFSKNSRKSSAIRIEQLHSEKCDKLKKGKVKGFHYSMKLSQNIWFERGEKLMKQKVEVWELVNNDLVPLSALLSTNVLINKFKMIIGYLDYGHN